MRARFAAGSATASVVDLGAGSTWRATGENGVFQQWRRGNFSSSDGHAAWVPYGNFSTPLPADRMMWNCGSDGSLCADMSGEAGPTEAFFGLGFNVRKLTGTTASIKILGDDFVHLWFNGTAVFDGLLDEAGGEPFTVDLTPYLLLGENVLAARVLDGHLESAAACSDRAAGDPTGGWSTVNTVRGDFCKGDRVNEYLYVEGSAQVPEPSVLALVALGMVLAARTSRRRPEAQPKAAAV